MKYLRISKSCRLIGGFPIISLLLKAGNYLDLIRKSMLISVEQLHTKLLLLFVVHKAGVITTGSVNNFIVLTQCTIYLL